MLVLSLGFVLTLVPAVEHLFYCFYLVKTILNKIEACRFGNSGVLQGGRSKNSHKMSSF